jgi:hypothetical protein
VNVSIEPQPVEVEPRKRKRKSVSKGKDATQPDTPVAEAGEIINGIAPPAEPMDVVVSGRLVEDGPVHATEDEGPPKKKKPSKQPKTQQKVQGQPETTSGSSAKCKLPFKT